MEAAAKGAIEDGKAVNAARKAGANTEEGTKFLEKLSKAIEELKETPTGKKLCEYVEEAEKLLAKGDIKALKKDTLSSCS